MVRVTHVGGPTTLLELDGWRILTDPTFDPPGRRYWFGWGTSSTKTAGPALGSGELGPVDVVLLSHDHHSDNLDDRGRACLVTAGTVLTTRADDSRLGGENIRGLSAGETTVLEVPGRPPLTVLATPCRHGPPLSRPIARQVIGFALSTAGSPRVSVWVTGDTVPHRRAAPAGPTTRRRPAHPAPGQREVPPHRTPALLHGRPRRDRAPRAAATTGGDPGSLRGLVALQRDPSRPAAGARPRRPRRPVAHARHPAGPLSQGRG